MDDYERILREQLADLHRSYQEQAAPIIKRLVAIEACKPPPPIIVDIDSLTPEMRERLKRMANTEMLPQ